MPITARVISLNRNPSFISCRGDGMAANTTGHSSTQPATRRVRWWESSRINPETRSTRTRADPEWSAATTGWEAATKAAASMYRLRAERRTLAPFRLSAFDGASTLASKVKPCLRSESRNRSFTKWICSAALQAALDSLKSEGYANPNTIYLPPGVYRITRTLSWRKLYGKHIVGHGLDTRIVWDGDGTSPPVMFHSDGATAGVLFEGIVWDGAGKAEIGVNHCSSTAYESHVTHRNEAFINMKAGIVSSYSQYFKYKNATAEVLFDNCLFVNDDVGVAFGSYNALDNTVINCGFYYCGRGIFN